MTSPGFTPVVLALPSLTPSLALEVLPHGVTVHKLYVQADGKTHDLVIGPESPADFLNKNHKYHNTIVGRYSNRIPAGTHNLERDGIKSQLSVQGNQNPQVNLHGGAVGFDDVDWEVLHPTQATLFSDDEKVSIATIPSAVVFAHTSPDGDEGFPGTLRSEVLVGLLGPGQNNVAVQKGEYALGSVVFTYRAKLTDEDKKVVTPVNLTQHWGFNLEASLQGGEETLSVKNHKLTIQANQKIALDNLSLSTGKLDDIVGTEHHHSSKKIGDGFPADGYDSFYVFEKTSAPSPTRLPAKDLDSLNVVGNLVNPAGTVAPLVQLESEKSGLKLSFFSNQSGVQFYSANFVTKDSARKKIHGGSGAVDNGVGYGPGTAAFLEFHEPLAAWLHPGTAPTGNDTLLASGEIYNNFVKVDVTYTNPSAL